MSNAATMATYFVFAMLSFEFYGVVRRRGRRYRMTLAMYRGLQVRHFGAGLLAILITISALLLTGSLFGKWAWASMGWWDLLGGEGNVLFGRSSAASAASAPLMLRMVPFVLPVILIFLLPTLALIEERLFRRGRQLSSARSRVGRQLVFGLLHMVSGIGFIYALALCATGLFYLHVYLRRYAATGSQGLAVLEATRAHVAANLMLVILAYGTYLLVH